MEKQPGSLEKIVDVLVRKVREVWSEGHRVFLAIDVEIIEEETGIKIPLYDSPVEPYSEVGQVIEMLKERGVSAEYLIIENKGFFRVRPSFNIQA